VARIAAGRDHRDLHAGLADPAERVLRERARDARALVLRIHRDHVDLADAVALVEHDRGESDRRAASFGDPHAVLRVRADGLDRGLLARAPVRVEQREHLGPDLPR
jgi:hypothetical protein